MTTEGLGGFSALEISGGQQKKSTEGRTLMQLFVQEHSSIIQHLFASSEAVNAYLRSLEGGARNIDATSSFNLYAEPRELWTALATPFVQTVLGYVTMGYHFSVFLKNHSYYHLLHVPLLSLSLCPVPWLTHCHPTMHAAGEPPVVGQDERCGTILARTVAPGPGSVRQGHRMLPSRSYHPLFRWYASHP
jgi:hypothetical protein